MLYIYQEKLQGTNHADKINNFIFFISINNADGLDMVEDWIDYNNE